MGFGEILPLKYSWAGFVSGKARNSANERGLMGVVTIGLIRLRLRFTIICDPFGGEVDERYGEDFSEKVQQVLLKLDSENPKYQEILELFGATNFIATENENYSEIEAVGRKIGKI